MSESEKKRGMSGRQGGGMKGVECQELEWSEKWKAWRSGEVSGKRDSQMQGGMEGRESA